MWVSRASIWDPGSFCLVILSSYPAHGFPRHLSSWGMGWRRHSDFLLPRPGRDALHFCSKSGELNLPFTPTLKKQKRKQTTVVEAENSQYVVGTGSPGPSQPLEVFPEFFFHSGSACRRCQLESRGLSCHERASSLFRICQNFLLKSSRSRLVNPTSHVSPGSDPRAPSPVPPGLPGGEHCHGVMFI